MFKNYLITAFRNLYRHKLYSAINIGGLAFGLAACWLILLFVRSETGFDSWVPEADRIYRLHTTAVIHGREPLRSTRSAGPMGQAFKNAFDEVEYATRMFYSTPMVFHEGNVYEQSVTLVDRDFFEVFDLKLLEGNRNQSLQDYQSIILSESTARRYFGEQPALGKTLSLCCYGPDSVRMDYQVTGVIADTPRNTHFFHDAIALIDEGRYEDEASLFASWTSLNNNTYLKFREGKSAADINDRISWFTDTQIPLDGHMAELDVKLSEVIQLSLMPIRDIHLNAREAASDAGDIRPLGNRTLVISFLFIAALILGIAIINFLNLSIARFTNRTREVSMRKVLGASQREVATQFLGETLLTSLLALIFSTFLVALLLPWFNQVLSANLQMELFSNAGNLAVLLLITVLTGLLGGSYPSIYISRLQPARILNASHSPGGSGQTLLKTALIVFQFSIAIALIVSTVVLWTQTEYARSADLGYERENRLVLENLGNDDARASREALMTRIRQLPGVQAVAASSEVPSESYNNNTGFTVVGKQQDTGEQFLGYISAGLGYFEIYGIEPLVGRVFLPEFPGDLLTGTPAEGQLNGSAVLNVSATRRFGFAQPKDAIGQLITTETFRDPVTFAVVGVVPDINNRSARFESVPNLYWLRERGFNYLTVAHDQADPQALLAQIEAIWREMLPSIPFAYSILEERVRRLYMEDERQVITFSAFALLAIVISGMGLYAMASFTMVKRTREIGLRKVMGARVVEIVRLLLWQFSKPVVLANLLAWPVAWVFLSDWLDGFAYRIELSPLFFLLAGIIALLIAWSTVAGHAWRVARSSPIHALRYE